MSRAPPRRARSFRFRGSSRSLAKGPGVLWPRVGLWLPRAEAVGMAGPLGAARSWSLCRWRCGSSENGRLCNGLRGWLPLLPLAPPPPCCPPGSPRGLPGAFVCVPLEAVAGREPQDPAERMRFINAHRGGDTGPHCRHCCTFLLFTCVCLSLAHGASRRLLRVCGGAAVLCAAATCAGGSGPHVAPERRPDWLAFERLS